MPRFVVDGVWSGYTASQFRVVHRRVHHGDASVRAKYDVLQRIVFTDGTSLGVHTRPCKPRERVREIRSYDSLIDAAVSQGRETVLVQELVDSGVLR